MTSEVKTEVKFGIDGQDYPLVKKELEALDAVFRGHKVTEASMTSEVKTEARFGVRTRFLGLIRINPQKE